MTTRILGPGLLVLGLVSACAQSAGNEATSSSAALDTLAEAATVYRLPQSVVCGDRETAINLTKYSVTAAELAHVQDLVIPRDLDERDGDSESWTFGLNKDELTLNDESFLCDGIESYIFATKDVALTTTDAEKEIEGVDYYEMRGDETRTPIFCTFTY